MSAWMRWICVLWAGSAVAFFAGCQTPGGSQSGNGAPQQAPSGGNEAPEGGSPVDLPPARIEARTFLAAARLHESQNKLLPAIEQYRHALAEDPHNVHILNRLGYLYDTLGNGAAAEKLYREALQYEPGSAVVHNNLAFSYILRQRWPEAQAELLKAIEIEPHFARARMNMAMVLAQTGRFDDALRQFQMVLRPDESYYNMGLMYQAKRKPVEAAECYKRALLLNADLTAAGERLKAMPADVLGAADRRIREAAAAEALARATSTQPAEPVTGADHPVRELATARDDGETTVVVPSIVERSETYVRGLLAEAGPWFVSVARSLSDNMAAEVNAVTESVKGDDAQAAVAANSVPVRKPESTRSQASVLQVNVAALTGVAPNASTGYRPQSIDALLASELDALLPAWQRSPDLVESLRIEPRFPLQNWGLSDPLTWQTNSPSQSWSHRSPSQTSNPD